MGFFSGIGSIFQPVLNIVEQPIKAVVGGVGDIASGQVGTGLQESTLGGLAAYAKADVNLTGDELHATQDAPSGSLVGYGGAALGAVSSIYGGGDFTSISDLSASDLPALGSSIGDYFSTPLGTPTKASGGSGGGGGGGSAPQLPKPVPAGGVVGLGAAAALAWAIFRR